MQDIELSSVMPVDKPKLLIKEMTEHKDIEHKQAKQKGLGIYMLSIITRKVFLPFSSIGSNINDLLQKKLSNELEGRCTIEGFIKENSVRIINYSSGILKANNVLFDVIIECLICSPVEGMKFKVNIKNITKAGLRCDTGKNSPVDVFVARDHHYSNKYFNKLKVGDNILIRVIGQRYEINDERISVIAEYIPQIKAKPKVKLVLQ
jgi:DNA-directed RNA polymerase subunit E'/Rpb7